MVTMNRNKVVIVGTGQVGATAAFGIVTHGLCNELVLIDCSAAKALGEARDLDDALSHEGGHVLRFQPRGGCGQRVARALLSPIEGYFQETSEHALVPKSARG